MKKIKKKGVVKAEQENQGKRCAGAVKKLAAAALVATQLTACATQSGDYRVNVNGVPVYDPNSKIYADSGQVANDAGSQQEEERWYAPSKKKFWIGFAIMAVGGIAGGVAAYNDDDDDTSGRSSGGGAAGWPQQPLPDPPPPHDGGPQEWIMPHSGGVKMNVQKRGK